MDKLIAHIKEIARIIKDVCVGLAMIMARGMVRGKRKKGISLDDGRGWVNPGNQPGPVIRTDDG